jgi:hypothetical protein
MTSLPIICHIVSWWPGLPLCKIGQNCFSLKLSGQICVTKNENISHEMNAFPHYSILISQRARFRFSERYATTAMGYFFPDIFSKDNITKSNYQYAIAFGNNFILLWTCGVRTCPPPPQSDISMLRAPASGSSSVELETLRNSNIINATLETSRIALYVLETRGICQHRL